MLIHEKDNAIEFKVFVQPKSSRNLVVGRHGDALKVKLTAPPVEGAANKMCIQFFSKALNVPKSRIEIRSGHASRTKVLRISCVEGPEAPAEQARLRALLQKFLLA